MLVLMLLAVFAPVLTIARDRVLMSKAVSLQFLLPKILQV
jgi:hypothetical protein